MNLARHVAVLWRFRKVAIGGLSVGLILAILASYQLSFSGGPKLSPRGAETWTANSSILVTQPGFPEGRVTLPEQQVQDAVTSTGEEVKEPEPKDQVEFADPARLAGLADLYTKFITSDEVLRGVPSRPKAEQVMASPFLASAGGQVLPVIQLTTTADSEAKATQLNKQVFSSLSGVIEKQQRANGIGQGQRIEVKVIDVPEAVLTGPRKHTGSILVLALCLLGTVALAHLLEALRNGTRDDLDGVVDWDFAIDDADVDAQFDADADGERDRPDEPYVVTGRKPR